MTSQALPYHDVLGTRYLDRPNRTHERTGAALSGRFDSVAG